MIKKLLKSSLLCLFLFLLWNCRSEEYGIKENEQQNQYQNKSLWKEDEVYIKNVQAVFLKHANLKTFETHNGLPQWNYAHTFGLFDESYLMVPLLKNDKIVRIMVVTRDKDNQLCI
jgi:hypothetical protein